MSAYALMVDGKVDCMIDTDNPEPWLQAARMVARALGEPAVEVTAVPAPGVRVEVDTVIHFNAQQIVKEDAA